MIPYFTSQGRILSRADPRPYALTQPVRHYLIRGSRSRVKFGNSSATGPGMSQSRAVCSANVSATSQAEPAGMTMKHITVHPNAQVAQSVEQRTENPRVGSSILSLGTNSLFSLCTYPLTASMPESICCKSHRREKVNKPTTIFRASNLPQLYQLHEERLPGRSAYRIPAPRSDWGNFSHIPETEHYSENRKVALQDWL